jgi:hypothetical protein
MLLSELVCWLGSDVLFAYGWFNSVEGKGIVDVGIIKVALFGLILLLIFRVMVRICNPFPRPFVIFKPPPRPCGLGHRPYTIGDRSCVLALTVVVVLFFIGVPGNVGVVFPNLNGDLDRFIVELKVCF